jgi:carbamoyl-phosphate synthase small subunit
MPCTATADEVMAREPAGLLLPNGPGDPEPCAAAVATYLGELGLARICISIHGR